ncbi:placenta-specific protein 9 [Lontra canadensis]|uniref:placenta-specific protein 9 n=1 Tax=Lontra canadensis TaxID=76717 RepID=UPI0013F32625|nr:placenta-specific protein 9 [Lontra canadensis]
MELMTYSSVDGEKLPHSVPSACRFVGRRCGWRTSVWGSVKWAPEPLGLGAVARSPALAPSRSPAPGGGGRRGRRPGWHAGPSAPRGLRRGRIARAGEPGAAQESWLGRRAFPAGGSARARGRGGGETLRCARRAGSMRPLLCALAALALLRAAAAEPFVPSRGEPAWNTGCDRHMAVHDRLDVIEETVEKTVEHLETELKSLLGQLEELAWNLPPGPSGPTPDLLGDDRFGAPEPELPSSWK